MFLDLGLVAKKALTVALSLSGDIIMRGIISGQLVYRIATNATNARSKNIFNDLVVVN